ncbi:hypothetical protein [Martelella mangrovi]|uniref:Uncharacterized protein n=1 Tax=Martelella mangrovi TaxID=1397477 RepID=A0ABV2I7G7_9HYPH
MTLDNHALLPYMAASIGTNALKRPLLDDIPARATQNTLISKG